VKTDPAHLSGVKKITKPSDPADDAPAEPQQREDNLKPRPARVILPSTRRRAQAAAQKAKQTDLFEQETVEEGGIIDQVEAGATNFTVA
jgi:hypothetical protein